MEPVAELDGVSKRYGDVQALSNVSLRIPRGEVVMLLGPNGAGKTTALSVLLGLRRPDRGEARVLGRDPRDPETRRAIGVTPQETGFPPLLRVGEVVDFVRAHYPAPSPARELLNRFDLTDLAMRQVGGLSGGQRRRLAIAVAFAGDPRVVFLDEPTTGLDVRSRHAVWRAVRDFAREGGSVLLTTHYLEEAEALASRVLVLVGGALVAQGGVADIKARVGLQRVRLQAENLPTIPGVSHREHSGDTYTLWVADADDLVREMVTRKVGFRGLEVQPVSLEEALRTLTERQP